MTKAQEKEYELMKILEGYSSEVYVCPAGYRTVGVGFNMDQRAARVIWRELGIVENFDEVLAGKAEVSEHTSYVLFKYFWDNVCESQVRTRCRQLNLNYDGMPDWKKFILKDIVYQTGSIRGWTRVLTEIAPRGVLKEARRKQHYVDSRICKTAYAYGLVNTVEECKDIGLTESKYLK